jgi:hypothetical protein
MNVMREIQSLSAVIVFVMIHIPLTKISSLFSVLTSVIPVILDKRNKEQIYLTAYRFARINEKNVLENVILRKNSELAAKFKGNRFNELRGEQKVYAVNYTVFYLGTFFALLFNYVLTLYLG